MSSTLCRQLSSLKCIFLHQPQSGVAGSGTISVQAPAQHGGIPLRMREDLKPNTAMVAQQTMQGADESCRCLPREAFCNFQIFGADHPDVPAILEQYVARG